VVVRREDADSGRDAGAGYKGIRGCTPQRHFGKSRFYLASTSAVERAFDDNAAVCRGADRRAEPVAERSKSSSDEPLQSRLATSGRSGLIEISLGGIPASFFSNVSADQKTLQAITSEMIAPQIHPAGVLQLIISADAVAVSSGYNSYTPRLWGNGADEVWNHVLQRDARVVRRGKLLRAVASRFVLKVADPIWDGGDIDERLIRLARPTG
jgi:hypothetical protein